MNTKKILAFDLRRGFITEQSTKGNNDVVWRDGSWLHYNSASGMSSILMTKQTVKDFAQFLKDAREKHNGHEAFSKNKALEFLSEDHDGIGFDKDVNVFIRDKSFIVIFNIPVINLLHFAAYLEQSL